MREEEGADQEREMLDAVFVRALYAMDLVELCLGEFSCCDGWKGKMSIHVLFVVWLMWLGFDTFWSILCQVFSWRDLVIELIVGFPRTRGNASVGEDEVEGYVACSETWLDGR